MNNPAGRPADLIREAWALRFGINSFSRIDHKLTDALMCQLSHCKTDSCRRLILGISVKLHEDLACKE